MVGKVSRIKHFYELLLGFYVLLLIGQLLLECEHLCLNFQKLLIALLAYLQRPSLRLHQATLIAGQSVLNPHKILVSPLITRL
jgi:hypothetical protein